MLSLSDALAKVKARTAPDVDPVLSDAEIIEILTDDLTTSTWTPSTAYAEDQLIVPTVPMGRVFRCVLPGTSDTFEPEWLIAPLYTGTVNPLGAWWGIGPLPFVGNVATTPWFWGLGDGTAAWRDYGAFIGELYDVRSAIYEAWRLKAAKASNQPKRKQVGPLTKEYMTYDQCMAMARQYAPMGFV